MMENQKKLIVRVSPHIRSKETISRMMKDVIIALLPAIVLSIYYYRYKAVTIILTCVIFSCVAEYICQRVTGREISLNDLSAVVTGLLLALILPPNSPLWLCAIGTTFSIALGKHIFGGLGYNPFNPALLGRAFLQVSWPQQMSSFITPIDGLTAATPLTINKLGLVGKIPGYFDLLIGNYAGSLGETSEIALLLGAIYLLKRKHITLYTPLSYIFTFAILVALFQQNILFHLLTGGLFLGAFYMATDPVTTPITAKGKIIFGLGCGFLTVLIRLKGGFPEGVCFSILTMNMLTPIIDKYTKPVRFGIEQKWKKKLVLVK